MNTSVRLIALGAIAAGLTALSGQASAQFKWTTTGNSDCGSSCATSMGNAHSFSSAPSGGPSMQGSAWSNTGGTPSAGSVTTTTPQFPAGTIESAYLGLYSGGAGVKNRDGGSTSPNTGDSTEWVPPEHSVDNQQRYDSVLFSFSSAINLKRVEIGWKESGQDSDITVLAYTGAGDPRSNGNLSGQTYGGLTTKGWTFIGNYSDLVVNSAAAVNPLGIASAFWLIGAYIPGFDSSKWTIGNDFVKISALYGDRPNQVPEPSALLLTALALGGVWAMRRRSAR